MFPGAVRTLRLAVRTWREHSAGATDWPRRWFRALRRSGWRRSQALRRPPCRGRRWRVTSQESVVRIRCPSPADEARCRAILAQAGLAPEAQLTWLVVRDADPDRVNELLVEGGAVGRVAAREQIGQLIGFVLDHGPRMESRAASLRSNVNRVLTTAGLQARWAPRPEAEMPAAAAALHEFLMETRGGFVSWDRFTGMFCVPAA